MQTATSPDAPHGVRQVEIGPERDGQRIDNALMTLLKGVPKSMIYRILRTGQVRVNGKRAKPETRLAAGDMLRIPPVRMAEKEPGKGPAAGMVSAITESIIFEDKHFLAIVKPAGIAAHGGSGVSHGAIELLRAARPNEHIELVHRLDRDTSGVLVFSRKRSALDVKKRIEDALKRNAEVEAQAIKVAVLDGGKVRLDGRVHAWSERRAAEQAAWAAAGVHAVEDHISVG